MPGIKVAVAELNNVGKSYLKSHPTSTLFHRSQSTAQALINLNSEIETQTELFELLKSLINQYNNERWFPNNSEILSDICSTLKAAINSIAQAYEARAKEKTQEFLTASDISVQWTPLDYIKVFEKGLNASAQQVMNPF